MINAIDVQHQLNKAAERMEQRYDLSQNKLRLIRDYVEFIHVCLDRRGTDKTVQEDRRS